MEREDIDRIMSDVPSAAPDRRPAGHLRIAATSATEGEPGHDDTR